MSAIDDLFTNKTVGWSKEEYTRTELMCKALRMAVEQERTKSGLIDHSNRGSQYATMGYRCELVQLGARAAMRSSF